jgi:hypothetical protein
MVSIEDLRIACILPLSLRGWRVGRVRQERVRRNAAPVQLLPPFADADRLVLTGSRRSSKLSIRQPERLREEEAQQRSREKLRTAETLACEKVAHNGSLVLYHGAASFG